MSHPHDPAIVAACLAIVAVSAVSDFLTRKIPNLLSLGGLVLGIVFHGVIGFIDGGFAMGGRGILISIGSALLCSILPGISFARQQMGGGDVKLFAAIGAMAGPALGLDTQMLTFVFVLLVVFPWRAFRSGMLRSWIRAATSRNPAEQRKVDGLPRVVLAPSILFGLCVALVRHGALPWA